MKLKKLLAGFMTLCMLVTAVPVTAMAEGSTEPVYVAEIVGGGQYESIQAAVDAAYDGDTIKVIANIEETPDSWGTLDGEYDTYAKVEGKTVTIDLNGKTITVTYKGSRMLVGFFSTDNNGHLTLKDSVGGGTINVTAGTTVYALLVSYEPGTMLVLEGGNYILDKAKDSLIYTGGNEGVIVNGGTFTLGNIGTGSNGSPWIFNAGGQNTAHVIVNNGIFNADVLHQHYPFEVEVPVNRALEKNNDGTWTMVDAVAYVNEQEWSSKWYTNEVGYATLEEAIAATEAAKTSSSGEVGWDEGITLLKDFDLEDFAVLSEFDKDITFNGNGKAITVGGDNASITKKIKVDGKLFFDGGNAVINELNDVFDIATDAEFYIVGGTYGFDPERPTDYLPLGYTAVDNNDGTYTVGVGNISGLEAKVGKEYFKTFEEAIEAANKLEGSATVELLGDVELETTQTITGDVIIDGNGNDIIDDEEPVVNPMFKVEDGSLTLENVGVAGNVTVSGGELNIETGAEIDGNVTVEDGKVTVSEDAKIEGNVTVSEDGELVIEEKAVIEGVVTVDGGKVTNEGTIDGNVTVEDGIAVNDGTIEGDVTVSDGNLVNNAAIKGDVTVSEDGKVKNNDTIEGDVNVVGNGEMTNSGTIEGDVVTNENGEMTNEGSIKGNVTVGGNSSVTNNDTIDGNVIVASGEMKNNDTIGGNVVITGDGSFVDGDDSAVTGSVIEVEDLTNGTPENKEDDGFVSIGDDGEIIIGGPADVKVDGTEIEVPAGDDTNGNKMIINPDGSVTVKEGNEIIIVEKDEEGNETETKVTVPEGFDSISVPSEKLEEIVADENGNVTTLPEGTVIEKDDTEITVGTGGATVDENGNVTLPSGSSIKDKDANKETILPNGGTVNNEGEISTDKAEAGDTTVTGNVTVNPDGSVDVPAGGSVDVDGEEIEIVDGKVTVNPDGTVTVPEGSTIKQENGNVIEAVTGDVTVDEDGNVIVPAGGVVNVNGKPVTFPDGGTIGTDGTISEGIVSDTGSSGKKSSKKYEVSIDANDVDNGSVKLSPSKAKKGASVTITVTPDEGYKLDKLVVLDKDGNEVELTDKGDGKFTFKMPRGGVEVDACFVEADAADKSEIVLTIDSVVAMVNGEPVVNDVAPIIKGERTFLPIRLIAEELGATVTWNEADQSVTIVKDDMTIVIYIGQAFALVNGSPVALDEPAFIVNSRTYLPLRFIAENLGAEVIWDGASQTVTVVGRA